MERHSFYHSFGQFARNSLETVSFHKISTPGNQVKLRYFRQCDAHTLEIIIKNNFMAESSRKALHTSQFNLKCSLYQNSFIKSFHRVFKRVNQIIVNYVFYPCLFFTLPVFGVSFSIL